MSNPPAIKSSPFPRLGLLFFFVFQAFVLLTWAPLDKGALNPYLKAIGVVPMSMPFGDFKVIASAIQYHESGGDPYATGSFDFAERKYNYPSYWLKMPFLGVAQENIKYVYIVFASLFSTGIGLVFWRDKNPWWYAYLPFIFSPPVFLALERCNYELVVFFLVVLSIWISAGSSAYRNGWVSGVLMLVATILKFFPVFGFIIFIRDGLKRTLILLVPFALLSAAYFFDSRPSIRLIHENTPYGQYLSFGINVIPLNLSRWISFESEVMPVYLLAVAWFAAVILVFLGYYFGRKPFDEVSDESYDVLLFRGASAIFIAVYLMGSNFDYRLIFLIPTLPFIFRMLRQDPSNRVSYILYVVLMLGSFWLSEGNSLWLSDALFRRVMLLVNEICCWALLFLCIVLQFKLLPDYLRKIVYQRSSQNSAII